MMRTWQLQEAKNKFSEVVEEALQHGPQIITRRGTEIAIVLSYDEYRTITASENKISDFFRESPLFGLDIDLRRDTSDSRDDVAL